MKLQFKCLTVCSLLIGVLVFPVSVFSQQKFRIMGNLKFEKLEESWADAFCFYYDDLLSGKTEVIPIKRDSAGNFDMPLSIKGYQQFRLGGALKRNGRTEYFTGMSFASFFAKEGKTLKLYFKQGQDGRVLKFDGDFAKENLAYRDFDDAFGYSKTSERNYGSSLQWRRNYNGVKAMLHKKLLEQLAFHSAYFKKHNASDFVISQTRYDLIYSAAADMIQLVGLDRATDSMVVDFFKTLKHPITTAAAQGNDSHDSFLSAYYNVLKENAPQLKVDFGGLEQFVSENYPKLSEKDLLLVSKISKDDIESNEEIRPARQYMDDYHSIRQLGSDFEFFRSLKIPYLRDLYLSRLLYQTVGNKAIDYVAPYIQAYKETVDDVELKSRFLREYDKQWKEARLATLSPKAVLYLPENINSGDFIPSILAKYKGKVVYLDVWATWCAPCIAGMPDSERLRKEFEGKDVVFLYICIQSPNINLWKNVIAAKNIEGENYFLDADQSKTFSKKFNVGPIPHYMIFDKGGHLITPKAEGPENNAVKVQIEKLLAL